jgi:hypothetical protein
MRLAARICSLLLTLTWLAIAWLVVIASEDPTTRLGRGLVALALLGCAGLLLAWRRPQIGSSVAILAGAAFASVSAFAVPSSVTLAMIGLSMGGAFVLTGLLFRAAAQSESSRGSRPWLPQVLAALMTLLVLAMTLIPLGLGVSG